MDRVVLGSSHNPAKTFISDMESEGGEEGVDGCLLGSRYSKGGSIAVLEWMG